MGKISEKLKMFNTLGSCNGIEVIDEIVSLVVFCNKQGGSNMTGTCAACLHTNQSWSYLNHLVV
jgi:hypothetical protein